MERRSFLKLCCATVVAPSVLTRLPQKKELTRDELLAYIEHMRDGARLALIDDLESRMFTSNGRCVRITLEDESEGMWCWVTVLMPINYKT